MKIGKNVQYEYEKNNINEGSGYTKWYNKSETMIIRIIAVVLFYVGLMVFLYIPAFDTIIDSFKIPMGNKEMFLFFLGWFVPFFFILPFLRRIMQLAIISGGKFNGKCMLKLYPLTCIYNENTTRQKALLSLIVPCVLFSLLFLVLTFLSNGIQKTLFFLMVYRVFIFSVDDIGNIYCLLRNVGKNDTIFGEYKKELC